MMKLMLPVASIHQTAVHNSESLTFGVEVMDKLFGELKIGELVVFHGSQVCHFFSELLCVRSQLSIVEGGLSSPAVFIDGGNRFDPYLISENARLLGLDPEETLKNIWVSRAFTSYQLTILVTEKLPEVLRWLKPKLVVISDIAALYCDSDIGLFEAKKTFNRIVCFLWNMAKGKNLLFVVTSFSSGNRRKRLLEQHLIGRSDIAAKIEEGNPHVKLTLEKHPSKPAVSVDLHYNEPRNQFLLEEFMEV
ncbi:hypothetical protein KEJ18_03295 [Candidatus Bathyarchaeota archaeon]|nr:hypothetical protein [Candidatus Bathyarchaeota archaeon]